MILFFKIRNFNLRDFFYIGKNIGIGNWVIGEEDLLVYLFMEKGFKYLFWIYNNILMNVEKYFCVIFLIKFFVNWFLS